MALPKAKETVSANAVVVFSKSYCPFCVDVKKLLQQLGASFKAIELDKESDGSDIQAALTQWTGQRTVPNVFIAGKHIGGCDTTMALHKEVGYLRTWLLLESGYVQTRAWSKDNWINNGYLVGSLLEGGTEEEFKAIANATRLKPAVDDQTNVGMQGLNFALTISMKLKPQTLQIEAGSSSLVLVTPVYAWHATIGVVLAASISAFAYRYGRGRRRW